ncbi:hypothetical protein N836_16810 [Leptolyngbya sp. Heron Island J]|uniref:hypothetical protein n=1 Tax=Leptolyngbya sp. Heron Island J TaxID=1385935 RepID=UPI0003B98A68|nr:hypothetical protein [Leptolyngbya sp. Heron Island J]ESA34555.1 hypothetical protein N836_16810 [Leptolyngbya sp. Heron Island J]
MEDSLNPLAKVIQQPVELSRILQVLVLAFGRENSNRFIQRTGGRYRFVHNLLRKHFAAMSLE